MQLDGSHVIFFFCIPKRFLLRQILAEFIKKRSFLKTRAFFHFKNNNMNMNKKLLLILISCAPLLPALPICMNFMIVFL